MLQKRVSPLEDKKTTKKPSTAKPAKKAEAPEFKVNSEDYKYEFKKRTNPLSLNEEAKEVKQVKTAKPVETKVVEKVVEKIVEVPANEVSLPNAISLVNKRKFGFVSLNKVLLDGLLQATNMKKADLIEAALIQYAARNYKEAFKQIEASIANQGGKVK